MKFKILYPSKNLESFVKYFWVLEPSSTSEILKPERVVPAGYLQMFFHYKTPFSVEGVENPTSYFCGQLTKFKDVIPAKDTAMIAVVFYPFSAKPFVHLNVNELTNKSVALKDVYGLEAQEVIEKELKQCTDYSGKQEAIEKFLRKYFFLSNKYQYGIVKQATYIIDESKGKCQIGELSDKLFMSKRQIERLFKQTVGISPKMYAQIIRFNSAMAELTEKRTLTEVCYNYNYFDQAHFIKDFKRFTGMTPKSYFSHQANPLEEME